VKQLTHDFRKRNYNHKSKNGTGRLPMISPSIRALIVTTVFATLAGAPSVQAASEFDGNWALHAVTRSGQCDPNFQLSGRIAQGIVYSQGGGSNVA
jgi:hypothetical protein